MAYYEKLPSGSYRYQVCVTVNGKRKRKSFTGKTKKEALFKMTDWMKNNEVINDDKMSLANAVSMYISSKENVLSPTTIRDYKKIYRLYVKEQPLGNIQVEDIRNEDLQNLINDLAEGHTPKYLKNIYSLIHSAIKFVNPYANFVVTFPKKEPIERNIPTDEEVKLLMDNADEELRLAIMLAAFGTLRRGEICSLSYEDIDGNTIHIHTDMVLTSDKEWVIKNIPKTASSDRFVPLPQFVIDEMGTGEGRILNINPTIITVRFIRLRDSLGLKCRFHDLRHYAASIMHSIGIPDQYIMERGGWSSDAILKSVYRNVLKDKNNEFTDKTNEYFKNKFTNT